MEEFPDPRQAVFNLLQSQWKVNGKRVRDKETVQIVKLISGRTALDIIKREQ